MGIDIYMQWKHMSKGDHQAQITGFSATAGNVGYLREAYHGEPYATHYLLKEAFQSKSGKAKIKAKILRQRLPQTLKLVQERYQNLYQHQPTSKETKAAMKSYEAFVQLAETQEKKTKTPVTIEASY